MNVNSKALSAINERLSHTHSLGSRIHITAINKTANGILIVYNVTFKSGLKRNQECREERVAWFNADLECKWNMIA